MSKFYKSIFSAMVISCAISSMAQTKPIIGQSTLTKAQAISIATNFSQSIGYPVNGRNRFQPKDTESPQTDHSHNLPAWGLNLLNGSNFIEVHVDSETGMVCRYLISRDSSFQMPDNPMTRAEAIKQSKIVLTQAGALKSNELILDDTDGMQTAKTSSDWWVHWDRVYKGLVYRDQGANVGFDANSGELLGFGVNFKSPPPASDIANVSQQQAEGIALKQLQDSGLQPDSTLHVKTEIVLPNTFWKPGGSESETQPVARIAWTCQYLVGNDYYEAWVDRETGQVIGGSLSGGNVGYIGPRNADKPRNKVPTQAQPKP